MPKPPFFPQTYPFSCVPACLRMVLASLECEKSEPELRSLSNCDETGTVPSNAVRAVIIVGFNAYKGNLIFEELEDLVTQNVAPIVFVKVTEGANYSHAIVVYKISNGEVFTLDPSRGELKLDQEQFIEMWSLGLTIVIEKKV